MTNKSLIGKYYLPYDNSYAVNLTLRNTDNIRLFACKANNNIQEECIIKSEPILVKVTPTVNITKTIPMIIVENEFGEDVLVMYDKDFVKHEEDLATNTFLKTINMKNFNNALEIIGQAIFDYTDIENFPEESKQLVNNYIELSANSYIRIEWPESQEYMEEKWFNKEAILDNSNNTTSSTYFIPLKRII
jgi:hypothetical protein